MSESDREFLEFCKAAVGELYRQMMGCDSIAVALCFTLPGFFARLTALELAVEINRFIEAMDELA